jgi:DNA polymerase-3 subunit epsilon
MQRQRWRRSSSRSIAGEAMLPAAARANAIAWANAVLSDPEAVFLDTETTGFPPTGEVIDLAVVTAGGEILLDTLIRPLGPIPAESTAIHGLRDNDVASAPGWLEVQGDLHRALAGRSVVIYNMAFDRKILEGNCDRFRLALPTATWECAMLAYAAYRGEHNDRTGTFRWHKLDQAARHFGVPPGGHRALEDALTCLQVVRGMASLA